MKTLYKDALHYTELYHDKLYHLLFQKELLFQNKWPISSIQVQNHIETSSLRILVHANL